MEKERLRLKNRKNQNIVGILTKPDSAIEGTCIIQHGYSGTKEDAHIVAIQDAFLENNFQVFNFDTTNSFGESDGNFQDARQGLHSEDFDDVVRWVKEQDWYVDKLALSGHSMGGFSALRYNLRNPQEVKYLVPFAPMVSGELFWSAMKTYFPREFEEWREKGFLVHESKNSPSGKKVYPWAMMEEYLNHSLFVEESEVPRSLFIVGEHDLSIPPHYLKIFFDSLKGEKQFFMVKDAPHTPKKEEQLEEIKQLISKWISR